MAEAVIEDDGDVVFDLDDGSITPDTSSQEVPEEKSPKTKRTKSPKRMTARKTWWQSTLREPIVPYLPPPVTRAIVNHIDPLLAPYVGPEATVTLSVTLLGLWIVTWLATKLLATRSGRAVVDEDDNASKEDFDATIVLTGPRTSGKTRLFYELCFSDSNVPTLMSIKANVGIATHDMTDDENSKTRKGTDRRTTVIRYVDWPGYARVNDSVMTSILKSRKEIRLLLVLDATQPIAPAVEVLDQWLSVFYDAARVTKSKPKTKRSILILCHKMDLAKAKNDKRIKIQMRTELERIVTADQTKRNSSETAMPPNWCSACSTPLELDDLPLVDLYFCATTCEGGKGPAQELVDYCRKGIVPHT